ncbi:MAG: hypothetical protein AB7K37_10195 [Cyclobacteriaceae bacterium]
MQKLNSIRFFLVLIMLSCDPVEQVVRPSDETYYPIEVGRYWIYDVVSVTYGAQSMIENRFEQKIAVVDSFPVSTGEIAYVFHLSQRPDQQSSWQYMDTWSARIDPMQLLVTEGTTTFVKLTFPISKGKSWDGNAFNTLGGAQLCDDARCDLYEITEVETDFTTAFDTYSQAVVVTQSDDEDAIVGNDIRKEVFVRNVGLVYKLSEVIEYCTQGSCVGQKQIIAGMYWEQQLISHGLE